MENLFKDKQRLLKVYFLLLKLSYVFTVLTLATLFSGGFEWVLMGMFVTGLIYAGVQMIAAHHGERLMAKKSYIGLVIALILNVIIMPSLFFCLSLAGFYVLLNKEMRDSFPAENNPKWLNDFFSWLDEVTGKKLKSA